MSESEVIRATDIQVGDEIEFRTADGKNHRFIVGELPRTEIHILPEDVAPNARNVFSMSPKEMVTRHRNVAIERRARASAAGRLTAERVKAGRLTAEQVKAELEEPNREPTAEQERAWDEREDAARGGG